MDFFHLTATWGLNRGGVHPKFGRYFSLVGIAKSYFFSPPLDFYHECKEESWIFSTGQRHRGSPGEGFTLKFGRYFSLVGTAKRYFLSPPLDFYHECKEPAIIMCWEKNCHLAFSSLKKRFFLIRSNLSSSLSLAPA